jgi:amino acid permease
MGFVRNLLMSHPVNQLTVHSAYGGMVAFCVIVGDTIPHVLTAVFPSLPKATIVWLLADRRFVIVLLVLGISFPLSLYRDIAKVGDSGRRSALHRMLTCPS